MAELEVSPLLSYISLPENAVATSHLLHLFFDTKQQF